MNLGKLLHVSVHPLPRDGMGVGGRGLQVPWQLPGSATGSFTPELQPALPSDHGAWFASSDGQAAIKCHPVGLIFAILCEQAPESSQASGSVWLPSSVEASPTSRQPGAGVAGRWWGAVKPARPHQLSAISPLRHTVQGGFQGPWLMATLHKHRAGCVPGLAGLSQPRDLQEGNQVRLTGSSFTKPLVFPKAASLALRDPRLCDKARAETVSYSNGATGKGHRCHQSHPSLF